MVWYSTQWYSGSVRGWNASLVSGARNWQTIKAVKKCSQQQIGKAIAREKCRGAKWQEGCCKRKNSLKSWLFSWSWSIKNVSYTQQRKKKKERKKKTAVNQNNGVEKKSTKKWSVDWSCRENGFPSQWEQGLGMGMWMRMRKWWGGIRRYIHFSLASASRTKLKIGS